MKRFGKSHASWQSLLKTPARPTHILQLCDTDESLAFGAAYFAAEGLQRGEAVILTGTKPHVQGIRRALSGRGVDVEGVLRSGQLTVGDAHEAVEAVTVGGLPDRQRFEAVAGEVLARARADARFSGVRWWGEMSNVFHALGNRAGVLLDEEIGDALCRKYEVSLFCSFQCDRFDAAAYAGVLKDVCCRHSHVIPAEDYAGHRMAVNRAVAEVIGEISGPALQSLLSWKGLAGCDLPSSQAVLFWLRETMPAQFPEVLARARALHAPLQQQAAP